CFFFSSRRRHTRFSRDWSSDVCSSDLLLRNVVANTSNNAGVDLLTDREREILKLVAESHSTKEIAQKLGISVKTVDNHRTNLMRSEERRVGKECRAARSLYPYR